MLQNVFELDAIPRFGLQASVDQIHQRRRLGWEYGKFPLNRVLFFAEWNIAVEHVVEQKPQRPDGGAFGTQFVVLEEFRWAPDARAVEVGVGVDAARVERESGAKVDEFEATRVQIHDEILVLDVVVKDATLVNRQNYFDSLKMCGSDGGGGERERD